MELLNARRSRTVLTAANEGDVIAAVGRVPHYSHVLTQELWFSQLRVSVLLCDSQLHQHNLITCVSRLGGAPVNQLYQYNPSLLEPQFLQFTYLSNRSVIFCYSHCTCSYNQYTILHMYCVIHHLWHISTAYWEEWNIYCYVDYIPLLWWPLRTAPLCRNM